MVEHAFKVNYTISEDNGDINFINHFFSHSIEEARESIIELMEDWNVERSNIFTDDCAIYGVGEQYDVTITVEQVDILGNEALEYLLNSNT